MEDIHGQAREETEAAHEAQAGQEGVLIVEDAVMPWQAPSRAPWQPKKEDGEKKP